MNRAMIADRYRLDELIATGGMGTVYRAVDEHLGRPVAVKVLKRVLADDPMFLERFRREARAAAAVSHPNVARVYDYGERASEPFIVMELVEGETLAERIAQRGPLPWQEAFAIAEQVASALAAAHANGLVHRDVKPANILLSPNGSAKVTDFGIARAAQATTLTRPGMVLGSANYVAPEQARGGQVGPAADLYSLGCVLFEAVTGSTPYTGRNAVAIATQHVSAPVPDPCERVPDLPAGAAKLVMRSLEKDPDARFPSAGAMAEALASARPPADPAAPTIAMPAADPEATVIMSALPPSPAPPGATTRVQAGRAAAGPGHTPPWAWAPPRGGARLGRLSRAPSGRLPGRRQRAGLALGLALALVALLALPFVVSRQGKDSSSPRTAVGANPARTAPTGNGGSLGGAGVRVPDVVGERLGAATDRLRSLGLDVQVERVGGGRGRRDQVRAQSPAPGTAMDEGATVRLEIGGRETSKGKGQGEEGD